MIEIIYYVTNLTYPKSVHDCFPIPFFQTDSSISKTLSCRHHVYNPTGCNCEVLHLPLNSLLEQWPPLYILNVNDR